MPSPESSTLPTPAAGLPIDLYRSMLSIRHVLTKIDVLYRQGQVRGPAHLGIGQ